MVLGKVRADNQYCPPHHYTIFKKHYGEYFEGNDLEQVMDFIADALRVFEGEYSFLYSDEIFQKAIDDCIEDYVGNGREYIADMDDRYILQYYFMEYDPQKPYEAKMALEILESKVDSYTILDNDFLVHLEEVRDGENG